MRTEEQIVQMSPADVTIGTEKLPIKPLTVTAQATWRDRMVTIMQPILASFQQESSPESFAAAYGTAIRNAPETFSALVAEYAGVDPVMIKDNATPEQVALAFERILEMAYPF